MAFCVLAVLQCYSVRSLTADSTVVYDLVFQDQKIHKNDGAKQTAVFASKGHLRCPFVEVAAPGNELASCSNHDKS